MDFWISRGFLDFKVDFWISKWISGFHVDFRISKWISTFWILFEELLFVILKILLINKPSRPGCTQNTMSQALHSSPRRTAYCVHNILAHSLTQAPPSLWAGPGYGATYRIAGNFREAEIFAIFAIKRQLAKICSRENFFRQKILADELRTPSTVCLSRRPSKSTEKLS